MGSFMAGLVTGCLVGVGGTFFLLLAGVAFSGERSPIWNGHSFRGSAFIAVVMAFLAAFSHKLNFEKDSTVLLFLLMVLAVSKLGGLINGLIASAIASLILVLWFFPPLGSVVVKSSGDRLTLTLFLLIATLGSRLIGGRERSTS